MALYLRTGTRTAVHRLTVRARTGTVVQLYSCRDPYRTVRL
jgi:hypothetical protein